MATRNACKTCAVGMGGQQGGMRNEMGHFPEFCKKSLQAMAADMAGELKTHFFTTYSIEQLRRFSPRELQSAGRLANPLYAAAGARNYQEITWDAAIGKILDKLRETPPQESFFYFSGRSSNEAAFALQLFARQFGTNHINNCSYYCHQASGVGLGASLGTGTATVDLADVERADCFFLIGGNPSSNHPRLMSALMRLRRRGGKVIVINPAREPGLVRFSVPSDWRSLLFGSPIASCYIQPHIGGDIALMIGITKALLDNGLEDQEFLREHCEGFASLRNMAQATPWESIVAASGVTKDQICEVARLYGESRASIFAWTMGITHHLHGVENVQWIANLALLRGMVGRPGAGLLPIRGHSNVQGIGTIGVTPQLKKAMFDRYAEQGIPVADHIGLDTMGCMDAAYASRMRLAICLGGNLFGSNPDPTYAARALNRIDLVVYLSTHLNTGHAHGGGKETLILPVRARDEEDQVTTQESMFNYLRYSDGGPSRVANARSEVSVISSIGEGWFGTRNNPDDKENEKGRIPWSEMGDHKKIRQWIAKLVPDLESLAQTEDALREFEIPGRIKHRPKFGTPTGKAQVFAHPIPRKVCEDSDTPHSLNLMTVRSEGQFNTVVFEEEDIFRSIDRRDVVLINQSDIEKLSLRVDQPVTVRSDFGEVRSVHVRAFDVRAGNAMMYCPEGNPLLSRAVDPQSRTPAFKSVKVEIHPD